MRTDPSGQRPGPARAFRNASRELAPSADRGGGGAPEAPREPSVARGTSHTCAAPALWDLSGSH